MDQMIYTDIRHCRDLYRPPYKYEALSYTWTDETGDATLQKSILCNSHTRMPVTRNLAMALLNLRYRDCLRVLWVDAVCIHQIDDEEKNVQVGMVRDIYRRAWRVVAWVGQENALDVAALRVENHLTAEGMLSDDELQTWFALVKFIQRPWFSRVWIVQELAVAKTLTIYCGHKQLDWDILRRGLMEFLERMGLFLNTFGTNVTLERVFTLLSIRNLVTDHFEEQQDPLGRFNQFPISQIDDGRASKHVERGDLLRFVTSTRFFGATEPKDHIYALLGLVLDEDREGIEFTYSKNVSHGDVYREFVRRSILQHRTLDVLSQAGLHDMRCNSLPSWVPDWTLPMTRHPLSLHEYSASGESGASIEPAPSMAGNERNSRRGSQDHVLTLHGIVVNTIKTLTPGVMSDTVEHGVFEREWLKIFKISHFLSALVTGKGLRQAIQFALESHSVSERVKQKEANMWLEAACTNFKEARGNANWEEHWTSDEHQAYIRTLIGDLPFKPLGSAHKVLVADCYTIWCERLSLNPIWVFRTFWASGIPVRPELKEIFSRHEKSWLSEERSRNEKRGMVQINSSTRYPMFANEKLLNFCRAGKRQWKKLRGLDDADSSRAPAERDAGRSHLMHDDESVKQLVARMFSRAVERIAVRNRQFCTTSWRRSIGWVPSGAQIGDVVCLLEGGRVPYILRPVQGEQLQYRFIGDAYADGLMKGEGWVGNLQWISLV